MVNYEDRLDLTPPRTALPTWVLDRLDSPASAEGADDQGVEPTPSASAAITTIVESETGPESGAPDGSAVIGIAYAKAGYQAARQRLGAVATSASSTDLLAAVRQINVYGFGLDLATAGPSLPAGDAALVEFSDYCFWHGFALAACEAASVG